jgi:hypothetical protein
MEQYRHWINRVHPTRQGQAAGPSGIFTIESRYELSPVATDYPASLSASTIHYAVSLAASIYFSSWATAAVDPCRPVRTSEFFALLYEAQGEAAPAGVAVAAVVVAAALGVSQDCPCGTS